MLLDTAITNSNTASSISDPTFHQQHLPLLHLMCNHHHHLTSQTQSTHHHQAYHPFAVSRLHQFMPMWRKRSTLWRITDWNMQSRRRAHRVLISVEQIQRLPARAHHPPNEYESDESHVVLLSVINLIHIFNLTTLALANVCSRFQFFC